MHTVEIHGNALPVTAFNGVRVLTTERLAKVFGASTTQVINNYDRNVDRFEEGKHFFKVDGDDLRDLKNSISFRDAVGKNAKSLMLWTDRGASRHAKILDTDMAWDVYGELEEAYFANRADRQPMTLAEMALQNAQALVDMERREREQDARIDAVKSDVAEIKQALTVLPSVPANGELITYLRQRMNDEYGLSAQIVNQVIDCSPYGLSPKFAVRNTHENAEGSANMGYFKREVNAVFRRFIDECVQVTPTMCTHHYIKGRFRLILPKRE